MFAYAARDHSKHYGTTIDQYAKVTYKNRRHGVMNNRACFQVRMPTGHVHVSLHIKYVIRTYVYVYVCILKITVLGHK